LLRKKLALAAAILAAVVAFITYFRWSSAIRQPLMFSHARHVKAGKPCEACHKNLESLPGTDICRKCHTRKSFPAEVQWIPVYRIAPDVKFHHAGHARVPCAKCHEEFTSARKWIHESRFDMPFCTKCHEQTGASTKCRMCHRNR
jgi:hypothetical protein